MSELITLRLLDPFTGGAIQTGHCDTVVTNRPTTNDETLRKQHHSVLDLYGSCWCAQKMVLIGGGTSRGTSQGAVSLYQIYVVPNSFSLSYVSWNQCPGLNSGRPRACLLLELSQPRPLYSSLIMSNCSTS